MSVVTDEKPFTESIKETQYAGKWLLVLLIMSAVNIVLSKSYGPLKENFFSADLTNRFMSSNKLMFIYTIIMFLVMFITREKSRMRVFKGATKEENTEENTDFLIYIIISLATFVYCSAYIRRKFNTGTMKGGGDEGILKDTVSKISSTSFGTLTLYVGLLIIILNVITNTFQYLKDRKKNQKDKALRAIYYGQISTMFQFVITAFFVFGFGMNSFSKQGPMKTGVNIFKWLVIITASVLGIHYINKGTNYQNWFGEVKG